MTSPYESGDESVISNSISDSRLTSKDEIRPTPRDFRNDPRNMTTEKYYANQPMEENQTKVGSDLEDASEESLDTDARTWDEVVVPPEEQIQEQQLEESAFPVYVDAAHAALDGSQFEPLNGTVEEPEESESPPEGQLTDDEEEDDCPY